MRDIIFRRARLVEPDLAGADAPARATSSPAAPRSASACSGPGHRRGVDRGDRHAHQPGRGARRAGMRICVVGAGAIGGLLAVKLAAAGEEVTVIARGAHLAAIRERGLRLVEDGEEEVARVRATDRAAPKRARRTSSSSGMKAHQLAPRRAGDARAVGPRDRRSSPPRTASRGGTSMNHGGPLRGHAPRERRPGRRHRARTCDVERVDRLHHLPCGRDRRARRHPAHRGQPHPLGELDGAETPRVRALPELLASAGFKARVRRRPPLGDLGEALGQLHLQPDQRADPRDAGRHLPGPGARARSPRR